MPKLEYPAVFDNGVVGMRVTQTIQNREAFLHVPYKMLFTVKRVMDNQDLKGVIEKYHDLFFECDGDKKLISEYLILILGMFYEVSLGTSSYFYPWLRMILDQDVGTNWNDSELALLQDDYMADLIQ